MRSIELFAGAGGLGMGAARAGFEAQAVVEWDRDCCDTIRENKDRAHPLVSHWPLMRTDVREFDFSSVIGDVDLVSGGPPCQPFSICGKHAGPMDARDMFPQVVRAVRELRPRAFMVENVKGLTRTTFADYVEYIRLQLAFPDVEALAGEGRSDHHARLERHQTTGETSGLHYRIVMRLLNAADYGVPQKRERVFLVGFRSDLGVEWNFPRPTHCEDALVWSQRRRGEYWERHRVIAPIEMSSRRPSERSSLLPWLTVRDAIRDLPDPEIFPNGAPGILNHRFQPGARAYPGHTGSPLDEPAKTLKAGDHGVPGGENMVRYNDGSLRYFTVRESARLQTFPDDYLFHGSWTETMRQLGNAVPVKLAEVVAGSIRDQLLARDG